MSFLETISSNLGMIFWKLFDNSRGSLLKLLERPGMKELSEMLCSFTCLLHSFQQL